MSGSKYEKEKKMKELTRPLIILGQVLSLYST